MNIFDRYSVHIYMLNKVVLHYYYYYHFIGRSIFCCNVRGRFLCGRLSWLLSSTTLHYSLVINAVVVAAADVDGNTNAVVVSNGDDDNNKCWRRNWYMVRHPSKHNSIAAAVVWVVLVLSLTWSSGRLLPSGICNVCCSHTAMSLWLFLSLLSSSSCFDIIGNGHFFAGWIGQ